MNNTILYKTVVVTLFLLLFARPYAVYSGEWRIIPIRLDLDKDTKYGLITVISESKEKIHVQIKAMEWTQDSEGKDRYIDTSDITYFPKIMILGSGEEKALRVGLKELPSLRERTYRLFIEEIPTPSEAKEPSIAIALRFGIPVFVRPQTTIETRGEIEKIEMQNSLLKIRVKNTGNVQFKIDSIHIRGWDKDEKEIFSKELSGWYLLNGASRPYSAEIPREICGNLKRVDVEVRAGEFRFSSPLSVDKAMCPS